jgi:hypothetical protein
MLNKLRTVALVPLVAIVSSSAGAQTSGACLPRDAMMTNIIGYFTGMVTSTSPADVAFRDSLGLSRVTPSQIVAVNDRRLCTRAARKINELATTPKLQRSLYVARLGSSFAVLDPTMKAGEWTPAMVFEKNWKLRRALLAF